jgi:hypothetical protein
MTEKYDPKGNPDIPAAEPTVFDFRDPNLRFETGTKIVGMEIWEDVTKVFTKLVKSIAKSAQLNTDIPIRILRHPDLTTQIQRRDAKYGFYGTSTGFTIKILQTDLSLIRPGRKTEPDPKLARTFALSRVIHSSTLPEEGAIVSTACTVSLVGKGFSEFLNNYEDNKDFIQNFGASVGLKSIKEAALITIRDSRNTTTSVGTGRQNHIVPRIGGL